MKNFEQQYNEWVDEVITPEEQVRLEKECDPRWQQAAAADRRLGSLMRKSLQSPALHNADFLNHSILETIRRETAPKAERATPRRFLGFLPRPVLAAAGLAFVCAVGLFVSMREPTMNTVDLAAGMSNRPVIEVSNTAPGIHATAFAEESYAVLWVEGMDFIPAGHTIQ